MSAAKSRGTYAIVKGVPFQGTVIGVRQIQDWGRIQIPSEVRKKLSLKDGDYAFWVEDGERFFICKQTRMDQD